MIVTIKDRKTSGVTQTTCSRVKIEVEEMIYTITMDFRKGSIRVNKIDSKPERDDRSIHIDPCVSNEIIIY